LATRQDADSLLIPQNPVGIKWFCQVEVAGSAQKKELTAPFRPYKEVMSQMVLTATLKRNPEDPMTPIFADRLFYFWFYYFYAPCPPVVR
jgi:hypothetical protein